VTSTIDVIVPAGAGGRQLLRTADSLRRQRLAPSSTAIVKSASVPAPPLIMSVASRLNATVLEGSSYPGLALNAAVNSGSGAYFVVVPTGFTLDATFLERCQLAFCDEPLAAIAPAVTVRTADGAGRLLWHPDVLSAATILSATRGVPPVFAVRRNAWNLIAGFDETLADLIEYDFWLRLVSSGRRVDALREPLVDREFDQTQEPMNDETRLAQFRAVLDRNRSVLERDMKEVLVNREVRFGQLREMHRRLIATRDEELAELDRVRAEASHLCAYLEHHHRDGFDWGDFRRTNPVSRDWGYDRGTPIDRRYIDDFLCAHSSDVHGVVLEVQEDDLTIACGGRRVTRHEILDIDASNRLATVLADLRHAPELASDTFDCIILTQTLHVLDDVRAALAECYRILKPGGVLLATFPAASRVCLEYGEDGDFWRMTPAGARTLVNSAFVSSEISSEPFGNVLTNAAFLHGLSASELTDAEFDEFDPYFPAVTGIRAKKRRGDPRPGPRGLVLLYHRIDNIPDVHGLGVPPDLFEVHLQWLQSECHIVALDDLLGAPVEDLPDRAVALTFDDGYEDNLRVAVPALQQHGASATFFLTTGHLQDGGEYWWDILERVLLQGSTPSVLDLNSSGISLTLATASADDRRSAHWRVHEVLVRSGLDQRERAIDAIHRWGGGGTSRVRPMSADGICELAAIPGMTIGAHTVNHLALPNNPETRRLELNDCQSELRRLTGQPIDICAYPYGSVDRETAALVRRAWRWGLTCEARALGDSFDAARVPRLDVKAWPAAEFAARVSRLFEPAEAAASAITLEP
jgi:peptidoglycan/xylan/chitin deacetylase (PgdA/CDA1 family)